LLLQLHCLLSYFAYAVIWINHVTRYQMERDKCSCFTNQCLSHEMHLTTCTVHDIHFAYEPAEKRVVSLYISLLTKTFLS
jgi:hypothetical protein